MVRFFAEATRPAVVVDAQQTGPISRESVYLNPYDVNETTAEFALKHKHVSFKLFEKIFVDQVIDDRSKIQSEYNSCLPSCFASLFYYKNKHELKAAKAYKALLEHENSKDKATWLGELSLLSGKYPAITQGPLGQAYQASLRARK